MQDGKHGEPGWVFKPGDTAQEKNVPEVGVLAVAAADTAPNEADAPELPQVKELQDYPDAPHVEWTASEYVANPKNAGWFFMLTIATLGLAACVYFLMDDLIATVVVIVLGFIVGMSAARQPKVLKYAINYAGVQIDQKFYPYASFKTFSIADNQPIHYISLASLRRFMPPLVIHYDPADEDKIVNALAEYLPYEEHKPDIVDNITRKIRF